MGKCKNCGMTVSDMEKKCPFCDSELENKVCCPRCFSTNNEIKIGGPRVNASFKTALYTLFFGRFIGAGVRTTGNVESDISYRCLDCGKKFRLE